MPFTDKALADQMKSLIVPGVLSQADRDELLDDPTENNVRDKLTAKGKENFPAYWQQLGQWLQANGGDIATMSGTSTQGRTGGNPTGLTTKALYNDAFRDVNTYINTPDFLPVKAVSNQLRFISVLGEDD